MKRAWFCTLILLMPLLLRATETKDLHEPVVTIRQIDSLNHLADIARQSDIASAKTLAETALGYARRMHYLRGQAEAMISLASVHTLREEYLVSEDYLLKVLDIYLDLKDQNKLSFTYGQIAGFFIWIKNYDLAEKYLRYASQYGSRSINPRIKGLVFQGYASLHLARHEYPQAIRNLYLCLPLYTRIHDQDLEASVYKYLGDAFVQTGQYSRAEYNYRLALDYSLRRGKWTEVAVIFTRLAHIYQTLNDNRKNLEYNLAALHLREKNGLPNLLTSSFLNVGEAYWLLGRRDSANKYLGQAMKYAKQNQSTYLLEAIYSQLYDFALQEKRYRDAFVYDTIRIRYRNRMIEEQNHAEIAVLDASRSARVIEAQNDLIKQENIIQDLRISNRRVQTILFEIAFLVILSLILLIDTMARNNRKRKNELKILNERLKQEIEEHREAEKRLNRSEEVYRFLAENAVDVISLLSPELKRVYISPSCQKFYGYSPAEILAMPSPLDLVAPDYREMVRKLLLHLRESRIPSGCIYKVVRKEGDPFWAEANINPVVDPDSGEVIHILTVVRDISERMQHEEHLAENARQKEYLLREIHNRVKNNFTILTSLMNMQRDQTADLELNRSLTDLQLRVRTMSLVHEQLYHTREISSIPFDSYLENLTVIIASSFSNEKIRLHTDIRPCLVGIEMALPMGLIINELITNAYKYAFPAGRPGNLWVSLLPEDDGKYSISIRDDGIGLPVDFSLKPTQSMGMQIVDILVQQVEATLEVTSDRGACFRIIFLPKQD